MREIDRPLTLSHKNPVFMPVIKIKTGSLARGSRCVSAFFAFLRFLRTYAYLRQTMRCLTALTPQVD